MTRPFSVQFIGETAAAATLYVSKGRTRLTKDEVAAVDTAVALFAPDYVEFDTKLPISEHTTWRASRFILLRDEWVEFADRKLRRLT